jgi:hypothetical protein
MPIQNLEAVKIAKAYLTSAYEGETLFQIGLEEIRRGGNGEWRITIGFERAREEAAIAEQQRRDPFRGFRGEILPRFMKVIAIDADSGEVLEMVDRAREDA